MSSNLYEVKVSSNHTTYPFTGISRVIPSITRKEKSHYVIAKDMPEALMKAGVVVTEKYDQYVINHCSDEAKIESVNKLYEDVII